MLFSALPLKVNCTTVTEAKTFYASIQSRDTYKTSSNYVTARLASTGNIGYATTYEYVGGQNYGGSQYTIYRAMLLFDTTVLPSDVSLTILNATLSLMFYYDFSNQDFNITVQKGQPAYPHIPIVNADYFCGYYSGDYGELSTVGKSTNTYYNISITDTSILAIGGTTKLALRSSRDIYANTPSTYEFLLIYGYSWGQSKMPKLYVWYSVNAYRYIFHGAYYEDGTVANACLNCTLYRTGLSPYNFLLTSSGGVEDNTTVYLSQIPTSLIWNLTTSLNQTRMIYFDQPNEEVWLFIPKSNQLYYLYTVNFIDMATVSNAYLETHVTVNGNDRLVEREKVTTIATIPFWLVMFNTYSIRIVCSFGTHDFGVFTASTEYELSVTVFSGYFPTSYTGGNITCSAERMNDTWLQLNYTDGKTQTVWCSVLVQSVINGSYTTVYSYNATGNVHQVNYYSANASIDYSVAVEARQSSDLKTYTFVLPSSQLTSSTTNPFQGLFSIWSDAPIPMQYLIGLFLVLLFFGIFSYANLVAGCFSGWIMACFLTVIHWLNISFPLLGFAGFIVFLIGIIDWREKQRLKGLDV
jgi:hypothetical protein